MPNGNEYIERLRSVLRRVGTPGEQVGQALSPFVKIAELRRQRQQEALSQAVPFFGKVQTPAGEMMGLGDIMSRLARREYTGMRPYVEPEKAPKQPLTHVSQEMADRLAVYGISAKVGQPLWAEDVRTYSRFLDPTQAGTKRVSLFDIFKNAQSMAHKEAKDRTGKMTAYGIVLDPARMAEYHDYQNKREKELFFLQTQKFGTYPTRKANVLKFNQGKVINTIKTGVQNRLGQRGIVLNTIAKDKKGKILPLEKQGDTVTSANIDQLIPMDIVIKLSKLPESEINKVSNLIFQNISNGYSLQEIWGALREEFKKKR
jgi:hypothetical protein